MTLGQRVVGFILPADIVYSLFTYIEESGRRINPASKRKKNHYSNIRVVVLLFSVTVFLSPIKCKLRQLL